MNIEDIPREIARSLLSSNLINWQMKVTKAKLALLADGIEWKGNDR